MMVYLQCWVDGPDCSSTCVCLLGDDAAVVRIIFTSQLNPLTAIVSFKVADPKPAHSALWDCRWHYKQHGHLQSCVDKLLTMVRISFKSQRNEAQIDLKCWPPVNYKYAISPGPVIRVQCVWLESAGGCADCRQDAIMCHQGHWDPLLSPSTSTRRI